MNLARRSYTNYPRSRTGFTLVEATVSVLLVGLVMVAAMQAAGLSAVMQQRTGLHENARFLASSLVNDIIQQAYEEPAGVPAFGRETGELATSKVNYDDVDDYHNWSESPPQHRDGTVMPRSSSWRRSVIVERVSVFDLNQVSGSETGVKRITVKVYYKDALVTTRVGIRAKSP